MESKTKEFREQLAKSFIQCLEEKELDWKKGWSSSSMKPINASNSKAYRGVNRFHLSFVSMAKGYADSRWATFDQIKKQGWKLQKGSKSATVEYWMPYSVKEKKCISWDAFKKAQQHPDFDESQYSLKSRYYNVFNGTCIDGIPPLPEPEKNDITPHELIEKISKSMNVPILHTDEGRAYYSIRNDQIHLPKPETFLSDYEYDATALHELSHSTGAEHRLNRPIANFFGSEEYAYEELVAEISSCFMGSEFQLEQSKAHMNNHKAYVQNWIAGLKEKPEIMIRAIRDAEKAADYLGYHAGLMPEPEYKKSQESSIEVKEEKTEKPIASIAPKHQQGPLWIEKGNIYIRLEKAPIPPTQKALNENGFKWNSKQQCYIAKANENNLKFAQLLGGKLTERPEAEAGGNKKNVLIRVEADRGGNYGTLEVKNMDKNQVMNLLKDLRDKTKSGELVGAYVEDYLSTNGADVSIVPTNDLKHGFMDITYDLNTLEMHEIMPFQGSDENKANSKQLSSELRKKLQELEKAGITFSVSKNGRVNIPKEAQAALSEQELSDTKCYIKQTCQEKEATKTTGATAIRHTAMELTQ